MSDGSFVAVNTRVEYDGKALAGFDNLGRQLGGSVTAFVQAMLRESQGELDGVRWRWESDGATVSRH